MTKSLSTTHSVAASNTQRHLGAHDLPPLSITEYKGYTVFTIGDDVHVVQPPQDVRDQHVAVICNSGGTEVKGFIDYEIGAITYSSPPEGVNIISYRTFGDMMYRLQEDIENALRMSKMPQSERQAEEARLFTAAIVERRDLSI